MPVPVMSSTRRIVGGAAILVLLVVVLATQALAGLNGTVGFSFTGGVENRPTVTGPGEVFLNARFLIDYDGGSVTLSSNSDGTGNIVADDVVQVRVKRPNGTVATFTHDFSNGCSGTITPIAPANITSLFQTGINSVTAVLRDKCGASESAGPFWVVVGSAA